ncbi:hypothetical protein Tcan_17683 [Toxocara canis]|uniref:Uncharacterized protein n=1 Tax=Toxocara canis TaxID=6265 RepID=A0A0B2UZZ8_TOXCA|nr:hypothetical protein Tcan_17683 [Toxocara canis]
MKRTVTHGVCRGRREMMRMYVRGAFLVALLSGVLQTSHVRAQRRSPFDVTIFVCWCPFEKSLCTKLIFRHSPCFSARCGGCFHQLAALQSISRSSSKGYNVASRVCTTE